MMLLSLCLVNCMCIGTNSVQHDKTCKAWKIIDDLDWARMLIHCAQQSQGLRVESHEAAIDELGSAAYCIIN